jgi:hypothetical protein
MMTSAEFCCGREFLGLPRQWVAAKMSVHVKTIETWESVGQGHVPERAEQFMGIMLGMAEQAVAKMTLKWEGAIPVPHGRIDNQYPASFHRMIAARVNERTKAGITYKEEK